MPEELPNLSQKTGIAFYTRTTRQHASSTFTEEEQKLWAIHCYFVNKPCIFTVCCSMSVVSKTSCSQAVDIVVTRYNHTCWQIAVTSPVKEVTTATHKLGLNFTLKSWTKSLALNYECRLCMALEFSDLNYTCNSVPCLNSLPLSVMVHSCHACVNLSCLCSELLSRQCCILAVVLHQQCTGHETIWPRIYRTSSWNI